MDFALVISVAVLVAAPLLARWVKHAPAFKAALDGFVLLTVIGLITITLLPEAMNHGGLTGLFLAVVGFALPWVAEFLFHKSEEMTHRVLMLAAALALIVHAASDGALLAYANDSKDGSFLAAGIILHRIGVAIAVWWLLRPILTTFGGIAILISLGAMTIVGYLMVYLATEWYSVPLVGYWQAFAAGSLFHVVMHPLDDHDTKPAKNTENAHRIGSALGILFLVALIYSHYLQHGPATELALHGNHHDIDLLGNIARLVAPIALLFLMAAFTYGRIKNGTLSAGYKYLVACAPWTLIGLLVTTIIEELIPGTLPTVKNGWIMLIVWLAGTAAVIIHTGARSFFAVLMPRLATHKHSHSHS